MAKTQFNIMKGLQFAARNSENEQFLNVSYSTKPGVLTTRRDHHLRFTLSEAANKILYQSDAGIIYSLGINGNFYRDTSIIDSGYNASGSIFILPSRADTGNRSIFIAGGSKMRRSDGANFWYWGIHPPPDTALTVTPSVNGGSQLQDCDDSSEWDAFLCVVSTEAGIVLEGAASLQVDLTANIIGHVQSTILPGTTVATNSYITFYLNTTNPTSIDFLEFQVIFDLNGVSAERLVQIQQFVVVGTFTLVVAGTGDYVPAGAVITQVGISIRSTVTHSVYIDDIQLVPKGQNDSDGARYKYAYENSITGCRSNLNLIPSAPAAGIHNAVLIEGFTVPPSLYGVDLIRIFRDTNSNGVYQSVGTLALNTVPLEFTDTVPVESLGEVDLNDNVLPPSATVGIEYAKSIWLNDITAFNRVWRSVAGRYESFDEFFDASNSGDVVVGFTNVRGLLFILTREHIAQVINPDGDVPTFFNIANIGPVNQKAHYTSRDFEVIGHYSGIYIFDGANLKPLDRINTLFNQSSTDSRRINSTNINTLVVGSDNIHVWITYQKLDTAYVTFTYHLATDTFVEESSILITHEDGDELFGHIAGGRSGEIWDVYEGTTYPQAIIQSQVQEFNSVVQALEVCTESINDNIIDMTLISTNAGIKTFELPINSARRNRYLPVENTFFGQNFQLSFVPRGNYIEIYDAHLVSEEIETTTYYDTEPIYLATERISSLEVNYTYWGIEAGTANTKFYVDNNLVDEWNDNITINELTNERHVIPPSTGNNCRIIIQCSLLKIVNLSISLIALGTKEIQRHSLTVNSKSVNNSANLLAKLLKA